MKDFLPYFAGYIDGDGHFRFKKFTQDGYTCFACKIMVTSTAVEPLDYFCNKIGGAYYKKVQANPKWKPEYIYTLHVGKEKFEQIRDLGRYLIEKKSQFDLVERFIYESKEEKETLVEQAKIERISNSATAESFARIKSIKNTVNPTDRDFIYLAGYIDAEGCFTVTKKTLSTGSLSFSCHIRVQATKSPCIEFLYTRFGGHLNYVKAAKNQSFDRFQWGVTDKSTEAILCRICNHLVIKERQCNNILFLRDTYKDRPSPRNKHFLSYYNEVTPIRETIFNNVKSLNHRGT